MPTSSSTRSTRALQRSHRPAVAKCHKIEGMQALKPALFIRQAGAEDLPRIAWLEDAAFADPWPFDLLAYEFGHPRGFLLVASWDGEPSSGYVAFRHGGGESELLRLAV